MCFLYFAVNRLQEVGRLDPPKQQGKYEAGQVLNSS